MKIKEGKAEKGAAAPLQQPLSANFPGKLCRNHLRAAYDCSWEECSEYVIYRSIKRFNVFFIWSMIWSIFSLSFFSCWFSSINACNSRSMLISLLPHHAELQFTKVLCLCNIKLFFPFEKLILPQGSTGMKPISCQFPDYSFPHTTYTSVQHPGTTAGTLP